jgi:hypothetical protein
MTLADTPNPELGIAHTARPGSGPRPPTSPPLPLSGWCGGAAGPPLAGRSSQGCSRLAGIVPDRL